MNPYVIPGIVEINTSFSPKTEEDIFKEICNLYRENPNAVMKCNSSRKREYVEIRQITMTLIILIFKFSYGRSGSFFKKDAATARHAVATVKNLFDTDKFFREKTAWYFKGLQWPKVRSYN